MGTRALSEAQNREIVELLPVLRRLAEARVPDPEAVDDVVQEAVKRVIEARARLTPSALMSYGVVTLRNLIISLERGADLRRRHAHRLVEVRQPESPEEIALREEEREAIGRALARLSLRDREALIAHEVTGTSLATLARELESTPGAIAARLARARAKMRVEYLTALRRVELPSARCRPVLLALSSGDKRRQAATEAGDHLLGCSTCASLSAALLRRRRPLAILLPLEFLRSFTRYLRAPHGKALAVGSAGAATAALVIMLSNGAEGSFLVQNERVVAHAAATVDDYSGKPVVARAVQVLSVPSDEGFWVGTGQRDRVWVQLKTSGESRVEVKPGESVSFTGRIISHGDDYAIRRRLQRGEGRTVLLEQDQHIEVLVRNLRLR